jgi:hypothetical protein
MSEPITIEKCEICAEPFNLPMRKYRSSGGYETGDASLVMQYEQDELDDLDLDMVCPNCAGSVANIARVEIDRLRVKPTTRARKGKN